MSDLQTGRPARLASSGKALLTGIAVAAAGAAAILAGMVLPAEYGIDPTGLGRVLGLTDLGRMKAVKAADAVAVPLAGDVVEQTADGGTHVRIVIRPYGGREVKGWLKAGAQMPYEWASDSGPVEYDFHGEPRQGGAQKAVSFETGSKAHAAGTFTAPFEGLHGWFWKNPTAQPIVIDVTVKGPVERFAPLTKEGPVSTQAAAATETSVPYYTGMSVKTYMTALLQPAAYGVWDHVGFVADKNGSRSLIPTTEQGWTDMERSSLLVAELGNGLLIPGRRVSDPAWDKAVVALRKAALETAEAVKRRNEDELLDVSYRINEACQSCHDHYAPNAGL